MPERRSPTARRRELSNALRRLREEGGFTVDDAAEALDCSTDKILWMERAEWVKPKLRDVRDLLDRYGVTDAKHREKLFAMAREGSQRDWWQPYRKMLSDRYTTYIGLESEADDVLTFELAVFPGLMQTADYARGLIQSGPAEISDEEVEQRVKVRTERQRILFGDAPARLWAIIDEAALHRPVGGPEVMRAQIQRLIELAELPKITFQVIPFSAGPHPSTAGSFTILSFPRDPDAAYVETVAGELLVEEAADVRRYEAVFRQLIAKALSPEDTIAMLSKEAARN
ncbi:helix-turn-helix domain-containing protein [Actinoallomurus soli]|uniref:helix-turn-helix domain-containing protein n=1 Tax=Actinoallomurus soli TaxID=2952535 RepID=UPI002093EEF3|nr:helix-turn-helix transcriptional regulator [Actinoallomurus soli]MCO5968367.1 helix-turn-helix domain-containing protein [Actinoallomurus soli]